MNKWSHLANAPLIDWVIESLRANPELWAAARNVARNVAQTTAWKVAENEAWYAAHRARRLAAWDAARDAARDAIRNAAYDAILVLIAYDDCDQYLSMTYDQLLAWATLSERPQAILLLSLKWVQEHECLATPT